MAHHNREGHSGKWFVLAFSLAKTTTSLKGFLAQNLHSNGQFLSEPFPVTQAAQ